MYPRIAEYSLREFNVPEAPNTALQMKFILCDERPEVLDAWNSQFLRRPEVEIRRGDILNTPADAFLLPGNSFGFLDSGLELRVVETFGWGIQDELRGRIRDEFDGELLVGQAIVFRSSSLLRGMVYTPIWRTPRRLSSTVNVFLGVRGALLALKRDQGLGTFAMPGLGVGPGGLDPLISARQIRYAYEMMTGLRGLGDKNLSQLARREKKLQIFPATGKEDLEE